MVWGATSENAAGLRNVVRVGSPDGAICSYKPQMVSPIYLLQAKFVYRLNAFSYLLTIMGVYCVFIIR